MIRRPKLVGAKRKEVRLLRLCPHLPPGQRGEGREVGAGRIEAKWRGRGHTPEPERKDAGHTKTEYS